VTFPGGKAPSLSQRPFVPPALKVTDKSKKPARRPRSSNRRKLHSSWKGEKGRGGGDVARLPAHGELGVLVIEPASFCEGR